MPNRILRATIRQSRRWNSCNLLAQSLYIRLLTLVDDYGRYEAHPQLLASECFPYGDDKGVPVTCSTVDSQLTVICKAGLASFYESDGNRYIQLSRWKERVRTPSRFPDPPNDSQMTVKCSSNDGQMIASPPSPSPSPSPTCTPSGKGIQAFEELTSKLYILYSRGLPPTQLPHDEERLIHEISNRPIWQTELKEMEAMRVDAKERQYFPKSVISLLEKWLPTLDRARGFKQEKQSARRNAV